MPRPRVITVAASAVACALAVVGIVATTSVGTWGDDRAAQLLVDAAIGIGCPLAATLMHLGRALDRGARALAAVLLVTGVASAAAAATTGLALAATDPGGTAGWWVQLQSFLWVPGFLPLLTLVPLLYPDGLLPGRLWSATAYASVGGIVLLTVGVGLLDEQFVARTTIPKPLVVEGSLVIALAGAALLVPCVLLALASLLLRFRRSDGLRRRQVVVLLAAAAVVAVVTGVQGLVPSPADVLVQAVAVLLPPLAIGIAVTRHRLYDLDLAVCRALAASSLSVCLVGAYLSVFALLQALTGERSVLSAAVAAGVAGLVLQPLGRRLSVSVDRLYFGHRSDPYAVTSRLAARLAAGVDVAEVPEIVSSSLVEDLHLQDVRVLAQTESPEAAYTFPLRHRGATVGWLAVSPRVGENMLDTRDTAVLEVVADQAAPAVAALHLHRELQRSREQLVAAREEERHRIRHDLHDGLGATLAGLRLQVETAQDLVEHPTASRLLSAAGEGVAVAVAEVRTICEGLRPPGIDDLGLPRALVALASRLDGPALEVSVDVDEGLALDPALEVAVYRIASEGLANAARHARARRAGLEVTCDGAVLVVVRDDGRGIPADAAPGLGLASIRTRAEEVGGSVTIRSDVDGTEVRATLPLTVGGRA